MRVAAIALIRAYQRLLSPILSRKLSCRFHPTCSEYAAIAIDKYGALRGGRRALGRWARCRPDNFDSCVDFP